MPQRQFFIKRIAGLDDFEFAAIRWAGHFDDIQADRFRRRAEDRVVAKGERQVAFALGQTRSQRQRIETRRIARHFGHAGGERGQRIDGTLKSRIRAETQKDRLLARGDDVQQQVVLTCRGLDELPLEFQSMGSRVIIAAVVQMRRQRRKILQAILAQGCESAEYSRVGSISLTLLPCP